MLDSRQFSSYATPFKTLYWSKYTFPEQIFKPFRIFALKPMKGGEEEIRT
jgi:hypothetical protein